MNYIVRPMNKQTLMCFNFAGTKKLDLHFVRIFSFEITLLKMDTISILSDLEMDLVIILEPGSMEFRILGRD